MVKRYYIRNYPEYSGSVLTGAEGGGRGCGAKNSLEIMSRTF